MRKSLNGVSILRKEMGIVSLSVTKIEEAKLSIGQNNSRTLHEVLDIVTLRLDFEAACLKNKDDINLTEFLF